MCRGEACLRPLLDITRHLYGQGLHLPISICNMATARLGCKICEVNFSKMRSEFSICSVRNTMLVENVIPVASCVPLGTRPQDNIACLTARRLRLPILFSTNIKSLRDKKERTFFNMISNIFYTPPQGSPLHLQYVVLF